MAESQHLWDLTETEGRTLDAFVAEMVRGRSERQATIKSCIEMLEQTDEVTRMVAGVCVRHYLADADAGSPLTRLDKLWKRQVHFRAPGVFMHNGAVTEALLATGEFLMLKDFKGCAEILGSTPKKAWHAAEFLYQWVAARNPGTPAASDVRCYGLKSGRMSHSIDRGYFSTKSVLFHESVIWEYVESLRNGGNRHSDLDPIICLTVTDDPEVLGPRYT